MTSISIFSFLILILLFVLIPIPYAISDDKNISTSVIRIEFFFIIVEFYLYLFCMQFIAAALAIRERFMKLNNYLLLCFNVPLTRIHVINDRHQNQDTRIITELYFKLCECINQVNSIFTFPLIFVAVIILVSITFSIYELLREFTKDAGGFVLVVLIGDCAAIISEVLCMIFVVHSGSSTTNEAEKTLLLVTKIINQRSTSEVNKKSFQNFLIQVQYQNFKFENCFFTINWKLIAAVRLFFPYVGK